MITVIEADITTLRVDAIVNAASERLRGGGGVDGAVHRAAGPELQRELMQFPCCPTGEAVLTRGYRLPARHVIHAVGPIWHGGGHGEAELLAGAYEAAFARATERSDIRRMAFPAISTGVYGYPKADAARIAIAAMQRHEAEFDEIIACLFSASDRRLYAGLLGQSP